MLVKKIIEVQARTIDDFLPTFEANVRSKLRETEQLLEDLPTLGAARSCGGPSEKFLYN